MKRRNFFKTAAITGTAISLNPILSCTPNSKIDQTNSSESFALNDITIAELQLKMNSGECSSVQIVEKYLKRINEIDKNGPKLRSIIEINPDAISIAQKLDEERANGKIRGPLHGIPIVIKDNIDTGDKMMTTAGSMALNGFHAEKDAFIVTKLREAGAVLLAKTNLSEWANIRSSGSSSGWSGRGGQVRNPYCLDRTPCGSSSGTGAAIAANLCAIGIGTETDGSIVCPSGINGIVGIKPTLGTWSRSGIIPISHSQDTAGPMARSVSDAVVLLGALNVVDIEDKACIDNKKPITDFTPFLKKDGLKGKRLGIARDFFGFNSKVDHVLNMAIEKMKEEGTEIVENIKLEGRQEWGDAEWEVLQYELKHDLNKYFAEHSNSPISSLEGLIEFNINNKELEMPWFDQEIFLSSQAKGDLNQKEYLNALKTAKKLSKSAINKVMDEHKLDAIIGPTNGPAWVIDWVNGDNFSGGSSGPAAVSGFPNITVPAGYVKGLPVGISFFGKAWSEHLLIEIAYGFEQITKHRKAPEFKTSLLDV